ncbi:carboxypeptidase-like regulatory domain-containing protein [uncultured Polaribacter sp.]|uniref:carboxypeptidase-like regulatory domain-containing protein n=1 Tax=uncultured Polaribacter sp. TaxID=174711 RepID=UPI00262AA391|nr:carboxypeptidase-like regulatory domain-containing protein [uncultured Polaribacter sp.]
MKKILILLFLCISIANFAQTDSSFFFGRIIDSTEAVVNAHIINLKTKQGTFSSSKGNFKISANKKDSLQITSIGYKSKIIVLKAFQLREKQNIILLEKQIYNLDEIVLKKHDLSGFLSLDIKKTPKDYKAEQVQKLLTDIKEMDLYAISKMPIGTNEAHLIKATVIRLPNYFEGFGIRTSSGANIAAKKTKLLIKKLQAQQEISNKLLILLGDDFFFNELKIPKEKYNHFITFCSHKGIYELYQKNEILKLIKILKDESIRYLKL